MPDSAPLDFDAHVALLTLWLDRRREIGDEIERALLNVQGRPTSGRRDRPFFERSFTACFFAHPAVPRALAGLGGQLQASHIADGFEPTRRDRFASELDPLELLVRAYDHWDGHRWPGSSGRLTYAATLFVVFLVRQLEWLSLRVWDAGADRAGDRLAVVQRLLDRLNAAPTPVVFLRDAAWLIQTAQGPLTPHPAPYFRIAGQVAASFTDDVRLSAHKAGAKLAGGHMRSQLRYGVWRTGRAIDHPEILAFTRNTNSMDNALLTRDLVALLDAYGRAVTAGDAASRLDLADAIFQGLAVDPELYLVRPDLLEPYTTVEELWIETSEAGRLVLTALGEAARPIHRRYRELIAALAPALLADAASFDPGGHVYSPFGIVYGFCADLMANAAMSALVGQRALGLSIEDAFSSHGQLEAKRTRADGWAALPTRLGEREHFEHTIEFASDVFQRLVNGLVAAGDAPNASGRPEARLFVLSAGTSVGALAEAERPGEGAMKGAPFLFTSDESRVAARGETRSDADRMLSDRREGALLASAEVDGHWVGLSKLVLTFGIAQGADVLVTDVPESIADRLALICPGVVVPTPPPTATDPGESLR